MHNLRYGREYGIQLQVLFVTIVYTVICPFMLPVALVYFALAYVVYRYHVLYVEHWPQGGFCEILVHLKFHVHVLQCPETSMQSPTHLHMHRERLYASSVFVCIISVCIHKCMGVCITGCVHHDRKRTPSAYHCSSTPPCHRYVFERSYESGGMHWPSVFDRLCLCLWGLVFFSACMLFTRQAYTMGAILLLVLTPTIYQFHKCVLECMILCMILCMSLFVHGTCHAITPLYFSTNP